ncbi:DUF3298 domain-containing protein [bacterium]|nr:DUF3298 domain-containing protein [bacterium]
MNKRRILGTRVWIGIVLFMTVGTLIWVIVPSGGRRVVSEENMTTPSGPISIKNIELHDRSGVRAFNRGFRTRGKASFPTLPATNAFWTTINAEMEKQCRDSLDQFIGQESWKEFWWSVKEPSAMNDWSMDAQWHAEFVSLNLVSLIASYHDYTGGAHGNTGFGALTAVSSGAEFREVKLPELFIVDVGWREVLAATAEREINKRKRENWGADFSDDAAATVKAEELDDAVFTVTLDGLKIWFAPYEKGAYAEGSFEPVIPYDLIVKMLDTNGPAKWLPCFEDKR